MKVHSWGDLRSGNIVRGVGHVGACIVWGLTGCASADPPPLAPPPPPLSVAVPAATAPPSTPNMERRVAPVATPATPRVSSAPTTRTDVDGERPDTLEVAKIAALIVAASRSAYYARGRPCACPDDTMRNGRRCGGNSAYSKPGGARPLCFASDVSPEMIARFRATGSATSAAMGR